MKTRLSLTMNSDVIAKAKSFAKTEGRSLSDLVENYLKSLVLDSSHLDLEREAPITASLYGAMKGVVIDDYKKEVEAYLVEKYLTIEERQSLK